MERNHEHVDGELLRLRVAGTPATQRARRLLGLLEAELDAQMESIRPDPARGRTMAEPVLVQLEDLQVELSIDGNDVLLRRLAGSREQFDELCAFIAGSGNG